MLNRLLHNKSVAKYKHDEDIEIIFLSQIYVDTVSSASDFNKIPKCEVDVEHSLLSFILLFFPPELIILQNLKNEYLLQ
jgi:hypothetical protein